MKNQSKLPLTLVLAGIFFLLSSPVFSKPVESSGQANVQPPPFSPSAVQKKAEKASASMDQKNALATMASSRYSLNAPLNAERARTSAGGIRTIYYWRDEIVAVHDSKEGNYVFKKEGDSENPTYTVTFKAVDGKTSVVWKNVTVTKKSKLALASNAATQPPILTLSGGREVRGDLVSAVRVFDNSFSLDFTAVYDKIKNDVHSGTLLQTVGDFMKDLHPKGVLTLTQLSGKYPEYSFTGRVFVDLFTSYTYSFELTIEEL